MECKHCNNGSEISTDCKHTPEETAQMMREQIWKDMENSDSYKVGYLRGMTRTALYFLNRGMPDAAKLHIENGLRTLQMTEAIEEAK